MRELKRNLIALFVLLHAVCIVVSSLPSVRGNLSPAMWRERAVQHELGQWVAGLASVGVSVTPEELQAKVTKVGLAYSDVRELLVAPFAPYHKYFGTAQAWNLFTSAHRVPNRLEIELFKDGTFRPLYVARSSVHTWNREQLDDVRMRKAIYMMSWQRAFGTWQTFTEWVARAVARDFPDAESVRVRYWRYETPSPEDVRAGKAPQGRYVRARVLELEGFR